MKIIKKIFGIIIYLIMIVIFVLIGVCVWHYICNTSEEKSIKIPGDKIEIYDGEYIHAVRSGQGDYTIVLLPGMGTSSPYYDFYRLKESLSEKYSVIVMEPLGYGFSNDTDKARTLDNYETELSKILERYMVDKNIILIGHSYSGISNLNYANKHSEVKGLVCLDCTTAYQIETHVKDGKFNEEVPKTPMILSYVSPIGITRLGFSKIFKSNYEALNELLEDVPTEYHNVYKHLVFNKTFNKTIVNEINDIYQNQLDLFETKYRDDLNVLTILSDETIEEMKEYKNEGDFYHDWEEMHNLLISNPEIQHIHTLKGDHYIYHGNVEEITSMIDDMVSEIK